MRARRGRWTKAEILAEQNEVQKNLDRDIDALVAEMHGRLARDRAASVGCAYARFSTDFQHSVVDQLRGIFERAIPLGIFVPREHVFYDIGVSGRKSLRRKHFEELRLIGDETWYAAQKILASSPQRNAGRKPRDSDTATRPRILNGLLICPTHNSQLKVGGADGLWMFCAKCRGLPREKRPLYTPLRRDLALRTICRAVADAVRADEALVRDLLQPSLDAAAQVQKGEGSAKPLAALRAEAEKLTRSIKFTQGDPGDSERDVEESKAQVRALRGQSTKPRSPGSSRRRSRCSASRPRRMSAPGSMGSPRPSKPPPRASITRARCAPSSNS